MKFVPLTVKVKAPLPVVALDGLSDVRVATGLAALTVKLTLLDVPPPGEGLYTVTATVAALAMSAVVMEAVNRVLLT